MAMKLPGIILIRSKQFDDENHTFEVECHVETDDTWEGYTRINPFSGYQKYRKRNFDLIADGRREG